MAHQLPAVPQLLTVPQLPEVRQLPAVPQWPTVRRLPVVLFAVILKHRNCHTRSVLIPFPSLLCLEAVLCSTVHCDSLPFTLVCDFMGLCNSQVCKLSL